MISVVIPSYNRKKSILKLLQDLYEQEEVLFEVIVVDDCSPDDTIQAIHLEFPQVTLLVNEKNGGPCVTRNRGIHAAQGEWIVGLDSDVSLPDKKLLSKVESAFVKSPTASGFAFRILGPDQIEDDAPRWWHPISIDKGKNKHFETDYFSGTAYAFRKDKMIKAGLYPEILYMHYEEVELAHRVIDQGGSIFYHPGLVAVHHANEVSRRNEVEIFYKPRNQILLAVSCLPIWKGVCYLSPRTTFQFIKALKGNHVKDFFRAVADAFNKSGELLNNRKPLTCYGLKRIAFLKKGIGCQQD
jgi:GT2 family glycosyltransferase